MELLVRISFVLIMFFCYMVGESLSKKTGIPVEFKYILPIISLVFLDFYLNLFSTWLFKLKVLNCKALNTDEKIYSLNTEMKLTNNHNNSILFKIKEIEIMGHKIKPCLVFENKEETPEGFECIVGKNIHKNITLKCEFNKTPIPSKNNEYIFVQMIKYTINDSLKIKKIRLREILGGN